MVVLSPLIGSFSVYFCLLTLLCFLKETPNFANFFKVYWFAKIFFLQKKQQLVCSFKNLNILRSSKYSIKKLQNLTDNVTKGKGSSGKFLFYPRRWKQEGHGFHVLNSSPWPLFIGVGVPVFFGLVATTVFARSSSKINFSEHLFWEFEPISGVYSKSTDFLNYSSNFTDLNFNYFIGFPVYAFIAGTLTFFITIGSAITIAFYQATTMEFITVSKQILGVESFGLDMIFNFFFKILAGFSSLVNQYFTVIDSIFIDLFYKSYPKHLNSNRISEIYTLNVKPRFNYDLFNFIGDVTAIFALTLVIYSVAMWIFDLMDESNGIHTKDVRANIFNGFMLFVLSEFMVFFGIFWSYFYYKISPSDTLGGIFPPLGIDVPDALGIALANTVLLLTSGMSVNLSLKAVQTGKQTPAILYMIITLILGGIFLALQYKEYNMADFNFTDSVFGSIFYFTTGAHGFHVFLGFAMLTASLICIIKNKVNTDQNLSLILPIVYWHFVDVVWVVVFFIYYYFV